MPKTVIHQDDKTLLGDQDHLEIAQELSFGEMIFRMLSEQVPTPEQLKLFELILNLSVDHGPEAPSAKATLAASDQAIGRAVGQGIEQINDSHGGATEPCMKLLYEMQDYDLSAKDVVAKFIESDMKLPGFGHRIYKVDPRAQLLLAEAEKVDVGKVYLKLVRELESELQSQTGKTLPLNIDGAIAAILCGLGWGTELAKPVFIIARTVGLTAHYVNSQVE